MTLEAAAAAIVLAHDDGGVLPLDHRHLRRMAVLGPNSDSGLIQGAGSATVVPHYSVSAPEGLRRALGDSVQVVQASGVHDDHLATPLSIGPVRCPCCLEPGVAVRHLDEAGRELRSEHRSLGRLEWFGEDVPRDATVEVAARLTADAAGAWRIGFCGAGPCRLTVDGRTLIDEVVVPTSNNFASTFLDPPQRSVELRLNVGESVDVLLAHRLESPQEFASLTFAVQRPRRAATEEFALAVKLATGADAVVIVVDSGRFRESEGFDRSSMRLPGRQDDLVRAVAAVNPRTVVVVNAGASVAMPWQDRVAAVLVAWFPGQEFGNALADVLLGVGEPGGRLPCTWGARDEDVTMLSTRPVNGSLAYDEGLYVGYRGWLRTDTEPAYPFAYGMGYTSWSYLAMDAPPDVGAGEGVEVRVRLRNSGRARRRPSLPRDAQVYLSKPSSGVERPARWLAGFAVVRAEAGAEALAVVGCRPRPSNTGR